MNVYIIKKDSSTNSLERIRCKDEGRELQDLLERNPDLLPGYQINPEEPCRWLQIAREMSVPDPNTGTSRWSVDFFFADQKARPTFVECKRFEDTRSRREIVGQMLEYAANGHYYWDKEMIRDLAEKSAQKNGISIEESLHKLLLLPDQDIVVDTFFEDVENNLREGQIRLIFFLEEAPMELKSIVDFLNKQMERSEVLLVEVPQFKHNDDKLVVPTLFGYTEEARKVKRTITITSGNKTTRTNKRWDESLFFSDARDNLPEKSVDAIKKLYDECKSLGAEIKFGTGKDNGSFLVSWPYISSKNVFTVTLPDRIDFYFGNLKGNNLVESFRDRFKELVASRSELNIREDQNYPGDNIAKWEDKVDSIIQVIRDLLSEFQDIGN